MSKLNPIYQGERRSRNLTAEDAISLHSIASEDVRPQDIMVSWDTLWPSEGVLPGGNEIHGEFCSRDLMRTIAYLELASYISCLIFYDRVIASSELISSVNTLCSDLASCALDRGILKLTPFTPHEDQIGLARDAFSHFWGSPQEDLLPYAFISSASSGQLDEYRMAVAHLVANGHDSITAEAFDGFIMNGDVGYFESRIAAMLKQHVVSSTTGTTFLPSVIQSPFFEWFKRREMLTRPLFSEQVSILLDHTSSHLGRMRALRIPPIGMILLRMARPDLRDLHQLVMRYRKTFQSMRDRFWGRCQELAALENVSPAQYEEHYGRMIRESHDDILSLSRRTFSDLVCDVLSPIVSPMSLEFDLAGNVESLKIGADMLLGLLHLPGTIIQSVKFHGQARLYSKVLKAAEEMQFSDFTDSSRRIIRACGGLANYPERKYKQEGPLFSFRFSR